LAKRLLKGHEYGRLLALLTASLWFASPEVVEASMNGLETGLYFPASLATTDLFAVFIER
jgi:hypothetical protein